MRIRVKNYSCQ